MAAFDQSRWSIAEFCARHELVERTFCWWRWRLGRSGGRRDRTTTDVRLVPVDVVHAATARSDMVVVAISDIELRVEVGTDVGYVGALVGELRSRIDRVKILAWDRNGFVLYYKRLSKGRFSKPPIPEGAQRIELDATTLAMLLDGIDVKFVKRPQTWSPPPAPSP